MKLNKIVILLIIVALTATNTYSQTESKTVPESKGKVKDLLLNKPDSAYHFYEQAYKEARKSGDAHKAAESKFFSGYAKFLQDSFNSSVKYFEQSRNEYKQLGDTFGMIKSIEKKASAYYNLSNYTKASEFFMLCLQLAEKSDNQLAQASALNNLGLIYQADNDHKTALDYYRNAYKLFAETENERGRALSLINIGEVHKDLKNYDKALKKYKTGLQIAQYSDNEKIAAFALLNIGELYLKIGSSKMATEFAQKSIRKFDSLDEKIGKAEAYNVLGDIALSKQELNKAIENFQTSTDIAKSISYNITDNYEKIAEIHKQKGNYRKALNYAQKAFRLKDSLSKVKNTEIINQLKMNYEDEKKDRIIKTKTLKIEKQENQLILTLTLLAALAVISVIFFTLHRKKRIAYKNLFHKNIEILNREQELKKTQSHLEKLIKKHEALINEKKKAKTEKPKNETGKKQDIKLTKPEIDKTTTVKKTKDEKKDIIPESEKSKYLEILTKLMEEDKVYLNKNLNINKIAERLNTNSLYTSHLINSHFGINFNNFINSYRIKEAEKLLISDEFKNFSIEGIAQTVGFNSKSSFNNAFKKFTGITPSFYRKQAEK